MSDNPFIWTQNSGATTDNQTRAEGLFRRARGGSAEQQRMIDRMREYTDRRFRQERERQMFNLPSIPTETVTLSDGSRVIVEEGDLPPQQPKPVTGLMETEYSKLPEDIRKRIDNAWVGVQVEYSPLIPESASSEVRTQMIKGLREKIIEMDAFQTVERLDRGDNTVERLEVYVFSQQDWLSIIIDAFYAGVDYANKQTTPEK